VTRFDGFRSAGTRLAVRTGMTLEKYTRANVITLPPEAAVHIAACALEHCGVGALLVHDGATVIGVLTDRDIAVRVAARSLDPKRTRVCDVMSRNVVTLPTSASEGEAGRLMLDHGVRRIPLLDGATPVGMVTLDDLIVDQGVDLSMCAAIIRSQLSESSRLADSGPWYRSLPMHLNSASA
jgi:CBS domain-containing protein